MKRIISHIMNYAVVGVLLISISTVVGCKSHHGSAAEQTSELKIDPSIQTLTKYAGGNAFESGDEISLYAALWTTTAAPVLSATEADNYIHNAKFKRDAYYFTNADKLGYPANATAIDIYAIYPYNSVAFTDPEAYAFSVKADQSTAANLYASDLLLAKKENIKPQLMPLQLTFKHALSKFIVTVKKDASYGDVEISDVKVKLTTTASVNISTQTAAVQPKTSTLSYIKPQIVDDETDAEIQIATVITTPQILAKEAECIEVKMGNGMVHTFAFTDADFTFESNTITQLTLTVSLGNNVALALDGGSITDWTTGAEIAQIETPQASENKFVGTVIGMATTVKEARVTTQIGTEGKRTYTLPVTFNADQSQMTFEFRGLGNRPNQYPFTIKGIEFVDADGTTHKPTTTDKIITAAGNITFSYGVVANTITW